MTFALKSCRTLAATLFMTAAATFAYADPSASSFVDNASAKGIAEIEAGKLALEKGTAQDVKTFAQQMIDDHTTANEKLAGIATAKKLEVSDRATLMDMAKSMILQVRDGESFDKAYANNQVVAHEQTIELFREYSEKGDDAEIKAFAKETLPKLEAHLKHAKELAKAHGGEAAN
jgi:putative membrane protein